MNTLSERKSNILLLNLESEANGKALPPTGVYDLFEVFNPFGTIEKIIIFDKRKTVKAIIQFDSQFSAELAKDTMNNTHINNFGKALLSYTSQNQLSGSCNCLDYWDLSMGPLIKSKPKEISPRAPDPDLSSTIQKGPQVKSKIKSAQRGN